LAHIANVPGGFAAESRNYAGAVATSPGEAFEQHRREDARQCWGRWPDQPRTTVRAARGCPVAAGIHPVFQGSWKSATVHTSSGVIGGNPATVVYADRYHLLKNRVGFTQP